MVYQEFTSVCLRCVSLKKNTLRKIGGLLICLVTFQLLLLMWLYQGKNDPINVPWYVNYNKIGGKRTAHRDPKESKSQNFDRKLEHACAATTTGSAFISVSDFTVIDSVSKLRYATTHFVVIIPRKIKDSSLGLRIFEKNDQRSLMFLGEMLNSLDDYFDGATCLTKTAFSNNVEPYDYHGLTRRSLHSWRKIFLHSSWCTFARRDWSIQIRKSGAIRMFNCTKADNFRFIFQMCNIINGPVVLRRDKFVKIGGLNPSFGQLTLLDFFLRSKGRLRIGKFGNCGLSDHFFSTDRASLQTTEDFPEYSRFGTRHGILRIIKEDKIEWTQCAASWRLCQEKPFVQPTTLPQVGQPLCCSVVLGKMLKDVTDVFVKLGVKHLVTYGTLLGAVRSKAIIPWTHDVDISLERASIDNKTLYDIIQRHLNGKYYVGKSMLGMPRAIPLMPAHININTSSFFDGESDIQGDRFFSPAIKAAAQELLPVRHTTWRTRGYLDFYVAPEIWWNGSSIIEINGDSYITLKEIDYELRNWYRKNYMKPEFEGQWMGLSDKGAVIG